jgi:uncharacterized repeat protein (TIGR03803 family)
MSLVTIVILFGGFQANAQAPKEKTIFAFDRTDGNVSYGEVTFDPAGNLYGTTAGGGTHERGVVFELSSAGQGTVETVLHNFTGKLDGGEPYAGVIMDSSGNLYGTTRTGGSGGRGTVFELTPAGGTWTESVLYNFKEGAGGFAPSAQLLFGSGGVLIGTANAGGAGNHGTVFELSPSNGSWTETVLYAFMGGNDGAYPRGAMISDAAGNLYGTTTSGGVTTCESDGLNPGCGTVFELSQSQGIWKEQVLYAFTGTGGDGANPAAAVVADSSGNLYGTTEYGGVAVCPIFSKVPGCGTIFELSPSNGTWKETVLYAFTGASLDGVFPAAPLAFDSSGNLFGTTSEGGLNSDRYDDYGGDGTIFEISPLNGAWQETVVHDFNGRDGGRPYAGLVLNSNGDFYGTTSTADRNFGNVFGLRP